MRMRTIISILLCMVVVLSTAAQSDSTAVSEAAPVQPQKLQIKPYLGLSYGTFMFMGEIGGNEGGYHPGSASPGYRISLTADVNDYLQVQAFSLFGTVTVNEWASNSPMNFQSEIRSTGVNLQYNFGNFYARKRGFLPWVTVGIENMEFLSKSDLMDANGYWYHYWDDGTIRNIAQDAMNKDDAILLSRDYVYETDLRGLNSEGAGNYPDRVLAIPVGAGVQWNCGDRFRVRLGAEMHFTFTDRIDNISDPEGPIAANAQNDHFLYTNLGLSYDLNKTPKSRDMLELPGETEPELLAFEDEDSDGDGVSDFFDNCPKTPAGTPVDKRGCPLDGDGDGVPDYLDAEPDTPAGAEVDADGIALTDDFFRQQWLFWTDSIPWYGERNYDEIQMRMDSDPTHWSNSYSVEVAPQEGGLTQAEINLLLSFNDVVSTKKDGKDVYLVGAYAKLPDAVKRKLELEQQGVEGSVSRANSGELKDMSELSAVMETQMRSQMDANTPASPDEQGVFYRVQMGAFRNALSENIFHNIPDVLAIQGEDGLTRYTSQGYESFSDAASRRMDLLDKGFDGAFVTAYRNGTRITLAEAGLHVAEGFEDRTDDFENMSIDPDQITFTVELGAFEGTVSTEAMNRFLSLGDVEIRTLGDGTTHFVTGRFDSIGEAVDALISAQDAGIQQASITGLFNDALMPLDEVRNMLGADHPKLQH